MDARANGLTIKAPGRPLTGRVTPPGSKSITNRVLLLAALARGTSRLTGALKSDDTKLLAPAGPLFLGNAGTATRFLTAAVTMVDGTVVVDGDAHMRKRPIGPLVQALRLLGIDITDTNGYP